MKPRVRILLSLGLGLLGLSTSAQQAEVYSFTNLNQLIPDGNWSGLSHTRAIASSITRLDSVRVKVQVSGEFNGDLYCYLRHTTASATNLCVLLNRTGRSLAQPCGYPDSGIDVLFEDSAFNGNIHTYRALTNPPAGTPLQGAWQPDGRRADPALVLDTTPVETRLSSFNGVEAAGTWTLFLADLDMGATNMLVGWELQLAGAMTPAITWNTPEDITYGSALNPVQLNASAGSVNGTFSYEPPAGTILNAGPNTLEAIFTPSDSAAYLAVTTSVSINVLRKSLAITAQNVVKPYDGLEFSGGNVVYEGFVNDETTNVLGGSLIFSGSSQGAVNGGSYEITPGGLTSTNYAINFVQGMLTVTPVPLSVRANNLTKAYNGVPFSGGNGVTCEGLINGETADVLSGAVIYSGTSQGAVNTGSYVIVPGGLASQNYLITFVDGTLTINKAFTAGVLTSSGNPSKPSSPITLTYTLIATPPGGGTPTGLVQFFVDGTPVGPSADLNAGVASYDIPGLTVGTYVVHAEYAGNSNFWGITNRLAPDLLVNTAPIARTDTIVRAGTNDVKVGTFTLLSNDTDADGDTLAFVGMSSTSTNDGTLTLDGNWIFYSPPPGSTNGDSFTYTISDGRGEPVTGTVLVSVVVDPVPSPNLVIVDQGNGSYLLQFSGIPGLRYRIQFSEYYPSSEWATLGSETADAAGMFRFVDPQGAPSRYYRSVYP